MDIDSIETSMESKLGRPKYNNLKNGAVAEHLSNVLNSSARLQAPKDFEISREGLRTQINELSDIINKVLNDLKDLIDKLKIAKDPATAAADAAAEDEATSNIAASCDIWNKDLTLIKKKYNRVISQENYEKGVIIWKENVRKGSQSMENWNEYCNHIIEIYTKSTTHHVKYIKHNIISIQKTISELSREYLHKSSWVKKTSDDLKIPPFIDDTFLQEKKEEIITDFTNSINPDEPSTHITKKVLGVESRGNIPFRTEIELSTPQTQGKHIYNIINKPSDIGDTPAEKAFDAYHNGITDSCKCYATNVELNTGDEIYKNEWEHVLPSLLQSIINGLASGRINMKEVLQTNIKQIWPEYLDDEKDYFRPQDKFYDLAACLCTLAQNKLLLLSCKIFNQAKCSFMLYDVNYTRLDNGKYIIELKVDDGIARDIHGELRQSNPTSYIRKACLKRLRSDAQIGSELLAFEDFKDNLNKVADENSSN